MAYASSMEYSMSNNSTVSSSMEEDFTLYGHISDDEYFRQLHPLDVSGPFPGEEGFSMFTDMPGLTNTQSIEEIEDFLNPDFFKLPTSTHRESSILGLNDPLPTTCTGPTHNGYLGLHHLEGLNGYPTPPSTISSPYSPPTNNFGHFTSPKTRRMSSTRRRAPAPISSPPSSPHPNGASSPTGGKQGIFTCPKCNAVFTFKTNKTRHVNSRACEGKVPVTSEGVCTKEYPCPIDGCPTVIKRRKDNLAVHLKKIHGLKMERQSM
ncbi:hypothetical protein TWF106_000192 [Orbilia oligospora]|uniref:C2H2-type domain-containing protein n=1 Tax=Orbilia oligospora TaxID=2813651 RepID=A0A6G1MM45_ORBOL|nr:hypothetical protein TWF788_008095 [Orbilia oligospora]KAF3190575.1 hypothetical protein TWF788_008095 [Orbilia oligospora]KAF3221746.1 hypothetical protein TWF679_006959 [Orbilia oligospora]KAF3229654.1 hypothetical protein TWF106_000041 [Orbilia oligospora]KAF3229803.1 hypothetical protein TWF106_000192 [Orbilia oligospora]